MPPKEFEEFHGITADEKKEKADFISLLKHAPKVFWTVGLVQFFCWAAFMYMWTYTNGAIAATVWGTTDVQSAGYQEAGNWVGVLFAVQAIGSVIWAVILPLFKARKQAYAFSLVLGGIGFISTLFFHNEYLLFISYLLCLGRHACHAVHYPDQFGFGQKHGGLPGTVQRNHLCTANRRRPCRRRIAPPRRGASGEHAGAGRRTADCRRRLCIFHQRDDGASRSVKVYCGKTKSAP